jgi:uncharacterized protein (DUF433 family)
MDVKWIQSNPFILMGKPIIAWTPIPVELILDKFAAGETIEQLLEAYPHLTEEGIRAVFRFAAALRANAVYPISVC